jgi:hypothetical protein
MRIRIPNTGKPGCLVWIRIFVVMLNPDLDPDEINMPMLVKQIFRGIGTFIFINFNLAPVPFSK